jgi:hypothetical protein
VLIVQNAGKKLEHKTAGIGLFSWSVFLARKAALQYMRED